MLTHVIDLSQDVNLLSFIGTIALMDISAGFSTHLFIDETGKSANSLYHMHEDHEQHGIILLYNGKADINARVTNHCLAVHGKIAGQLNGIQIYGKSAQEKSFVHDK